MVYIRFVLNPANQKNTCFNYIDFRVMQRFTEHKRLHAIGILQAGLLQNIVARHLGVQRYVILFIHDQANNVTFQQDNARLHVMRVLCDYLTQQNIDVLRGQLVHSIFHPLSTSEMKWNSSYVICKISQ